MNTAMQPAVMQLISVLPNLRVPFIGDTVNAGWFFKQESSNSKSMGTSHFSESVFVFDCPSGVGGNVTL